MAMEKDLIHELTMLYLRNQDLKGYTPNELVKAYMDVRTQIIAAANQQEIF